MTSLNTQLWELIETHEMPEDGAGRSFIEQLTTEHSISLQTASVAIAEYRKFIYLCATRSERNVPSKAVDLVWHLHMQHTRDYWDVFCKKIGKPVHHTPGAQGPEHLDDYKATVASYRDLFGTPPKGIWRQSNKLGAYMGLIFTGLFICIGGSVLAQGDAPWFAVLWLGIPIVLFVTFLHSLTDRAEVTLVFECGDPFADDAAGDCGSGDGGGCGD